MQLPFTTMRDAIITDANVSNLMTNGSALSPFRRRSHPLPGEGQAYERGTSLRRLRGYPLGSTKGDAVCPKCGCCECYTYTARRIFKCKGCGSRFDLDCQYKTAFVLAHKIREPVASEQKASELSGEFEVDGAYFGGYVKPANRGEDRKDRRRKVHHTGKRQVVVVARERNGETLTHVATSEAESVPFVLGTVARLHHPCGRSLALG